jgi:hypothetical protein
LIINHREEGKKKNKNDSYLKYWYRHPRNLSGKGWKKRAGGRRA